jgi:hypothetical protein
MGEWKAPVISMTRVGSIVYSLGTIGRIVASISREGATMARRRSWSDLGHLLFFAAVLAVFLKLVIPLVDDPRKRPPPPAPTLTSMFMQMQKLQMQMQQLQTDIAVEGDREQQRMQRAMMSIRPVARPSPAEIAVPSREEFEQLRQKQWGSHVATQASALTMNPMDASQHASGWVPLGQGRYTWIGGSVGTRMMGRGTGGGDQSPISSTPSAEIDAWKDAWP